MSRNRYQQLISAVFLGKYKPGDEVVEFERDDIVIAANGLGIALPKNLGDVIYSVRYRQPMPADVRSKAPTGKSWTIVSTGRSSYAFRARAEVRVAPDNLLTFTKIPEATPGIVSMYAFNDEQALLAKLRYNRLVDIFTGVASYSLQNHLRTTVPGIGQVETDELYVGVDKRGEHFVFPVQAKGGNDAIALVQIEQDFALCQHRFPNSTCRPIAAQFMVDDMIALFEFEITDGEIRKAAERHYKLVVPEDLSQEDLSQYRNRSDHS